jgi:hypothetical protein
MDNLNKPEEKRSEVESTEPLSEERLDQVSGGVPKGQDKIEYLQYNLTDVAISSISTSSGSGSK